LQTSQGHQGKSEQGGTDKARSGILEIQRIQPVTQLEAPPVEKKKKILE